MEGRTAGVERRHARLYVVVGLLLVAVYFLLDSDAKSVLYDLLGVAAVAGVVVGILRNRPTPAGAWWSIALGIALTVSGDIYWTVYELITRRDPPFPSFADVLYTAGYPVLAAGLIGLCIARRPARSDAIDAAIIGTGFTLVSWTYFLEPYLTDESYPWIERVVSASYPAMDIPLVVAAGMLLLTPRARSRSFFLFAVAIVATLLGDLVYTQKQLAGTYTGDEFFNATWLVAYVAWGAAALYATERRIARVEPASDTHLSIPRLGLLAASMVIGTTVWLLNHNDDSQSTLIVVSAINALLVALVCIRLWDTFGAINQKERRFRTLVEHSSDIISVYDADGTMRYVSPAMTEVLGEEPSVWIDRDASSLVHPDDRLRLGLIFARLKRRPGEQRTFELRLLHRDGSWRTVEVIGTNRLGDPAVRGIVGNARDITARAEAEEALRRAEALNHSVIESGSDGVFAYDLNCEVTVWNPMMERTTGFPRAQVIGRSAFDVFPFLHETGEDRILRSALHGMGGIAPAQPNRMPETGQDGYYEAYYSPLRDLDGKITGGLCLVRNVTTRAQAEQALASHNRILALSASGATLDVVLTEMCLELEASMPGSRCSVMLIDQASGRLMPVAGPNMPSGFVRALQDAGGVLPGPAMGSCGTAVFRGATVISADIERDPLWDGWVELALSNGLRAAWSVPIFDDGGVALGSFAVYHPNRREPTERELELVTEAGHLAGMAIRARNAQRAVRFQADLLDQVSAAVVATDARGVITHWNRYATVLYGWDREDAIGRGIYEIIDRSLNQDEEDAAYDETYAMREVRNEPWAGEVLARRKNGSTISLQLSLSPITGDDGHPIGHVGVAVDLTERKVFEARLAHQAFHDALTGLPNRALFADRLDHALSVAAHRGDPVGVLMLDLDRFKVINDGLGHAAGDRLLIAVGERVGSCLRRTDTLARLGGDEFAVLLEGVTLAEARGTAERILAALQEPLDLDGREVYTATSIGVAVSSRDRHQAEELLRAADMALYRAKRAGRGMLVVFDPSERDASEDWLVLESDLRRALGGGELVLYYQPVLDLDTYRVVTVEALARWKHPTRGLLPPSEFIPLAEETGLITIITRWAVAESCRQLAEWKRELGMRAPDHVNVNLTTRDLRDPDFVDRVMGALADAGLPSSALRLEITEQVLVEEIRAAAKTLATLRAKGVRLAIDDFGAGASSLASLRSVDAEVLKLDRSFVRGITEGGDDHVLVGAITAMAHALGLQVTAEGIETGEQLAAVQAAGCDRGQGYFFARPMPAGAMSVWLAGEGVKNDRVRDTALLVSTSP